MNSSKILKLLPSRKILPISRNLHLLGLHCQEAHQEEISFSSEEAEAAQLELARLRNKSRLEPHHYNRLHNIPEPLSELECEVLEVAKLRAHYGRDGAASRVPYKYLWPSKQEMALLREYEQVGYPCSLPEMMAKAKQDKEDAVTFAINRQVAIRENMKSLDKWTKQVRDKMAEKEGQARQAKEKREKLIEEVRLMYGVRMDPHSEKFLEIVAAKDLEDQAAAKALKKQQKQQKLVDAMKKMAERARAAVLQPTEPEKPIESLQNKSVLEPLKKTTNDG